MIEAANKRCALAVGVAFKFRWTPSKHHRVTRKTIFTGITLHALIRFEAFMMSRTTQRISSRHNLICTDIKTTEWERWGGDKRSLYFVTPRTLDIPGVKASHTTRRGSSKTHTQSPKSNL